MASVFSLVVERKILHILLFCFACSSCPASCSICINTVDQHFCSYWRMVLSEFKNTLPVSKNLPVFRYMLWNCLFIKGQEQRKTSCMFLNKIALYKKHSYLTNKLQDVMRETPLLVIFERVHECVLMWYKFIVYCGSTIKVTAWGSGPMNSVGMLLVSTGISPSFCHQSQGH